MRFFWATDQSRVGQFVNHAAHEGDRDVDVVLAVKECYRHEDFARAKTKLAHVKSHVPRRTFGPLAHRLAHALAQRFHPARLAQRAFGASVVVQRDRPNAAQLARTIFMRRFF
jgi:hypothetical protein